MEKVIVQMEVPKESKEVVDFLAALVTEFKMKKPIGEIAASTLPKLMTAVEGFNALGEEVKSDGQDEIAGYLVQQVMSALKAEPVVVVAPAPVA